MLPNIIKLLPPLLIRWHTNQESLLLLIIQFYFCYFITTTTVLCYTQQNRSLSLSLFDHWLFFLSEDDRNWAIGRPIAQQFLLRMCVCVCVCRFWCRLQWLEIGGNLPHCNGGVHDIIYIVSFGLESSALLLLRHFRLPHLLQLRWQSLQLSRKETVYLLFFFFFFDF